MLTHGTLRALFAKAAIKNLELDHIDVDTTCLNTPLNAQWKCKDLKTVQTCIGYRVERDRNARTIKIHQTPYAEQLLNRFQMDKSSLVRQPLTTSTVLKRLDEYQDIKEKRKT